MRFIESRHVATTTVILSTLMFALSAAFAADRVARQPGTGDEARLSDLPCTNPAVVSRLDPRLVKEYRAAVVTFNGHQYAACYTETGKSFFLVYEDGDQGVVPRSDLLPTV